ncbi:MAG: FimV family protein, partial [Marinobacter sp.]
MKVRKLAVALALAGGLGSGVAQALGLGEIEIQSYLNQPLDAEIDVNRAEGVSPDDIFVNLASERAYERVGLTRDHFLTQLDFSVTTAADGELVITVTSKDPVREPYLNFLVEVSWPSGRVMREYSVLVDPPVYAEESGDGDQVQPARTERQAAERTEQPARRETAPREGGAAAADSGPRRLGPVQASDTLWEIARSVRPDSSVSVQQVMLALQDLNEDAFMDGNINRLKRGAVLRVPDMDDIRARSAAQANREVDAQNRALARPEPAVDATEDRAAARDGADGAGQQEAPDELRLVVPEESGDDARREGSAGGDGRQQGTADAGEAVALEELDRVERENEELNSRLEDLQDQDTQLAEMQQGAAAGEDEEPETTAADDEAEPADEATADDEAPDGADADGEPAAEDDQQQPEAVEEDEAGESDEAAEEDETAAPEEPDTATGEPAEEGTGEQPEVTTDEQPEQPEQEQAEQERGFLATAIDLIAGNFLYQIALGGFLVLLLLLVLMISRRRANRDNEFYQQFDEETGDDAFDLNLGEEEAAAPAGVLEEADRYVSYGQHDAAAEVLENAISREPSRSDLRLKLLAVYADTGNRAAFDKQYAELEAMEFDDVQPEAEALRARLEDVESTPSIDELESQ